jgi:hypothetical protein
MTSESPRPVEPARRVGAWPAGLIVTVVIGIAVAVAVAGQKPTPSPTAPPQASLVPSSSPAVPPISTATPTRSTTGAGPSPTASPTAGAPVPTGIRWDQALGSLGLHRHFLQPIAWEGGFAALDDRTLRRTRLWLSADGHSWTARRLPFHATGFGTELLAYRDSLVTAQRHGDIRSTRFDVWLSGDGTRWEHRGSVATSAATPGFVSGGNLVALGERLAVIGYVGPNTCCGARPGQPAPGRAIARTELGTWAWISDDGRSWERTRIRGVGTDPMGVFGRTDAGYVGVRNDGTAAWIIHSADGLHWTSFAQVPPEVDLDGYWLVAPTADGYVLAADTGDQSPSGYDMTVWRVSPDGAFSRVLEQADRQLSGLAAQGQTVVVLSDEFHAADPRTGATALVSSDGGATFDVSAGWPDMAATDCLHSVVIRERVAVAGGGCEVQDGPSLYVADLP